MREGGQITGHLRAWAKGEPAAAERLLPLVYEDLRALARATLTQERPDHTLQPTALVHEVYLRWVVQGQVRWSNRSQFFRLAARQIRRILVDYARRRRSRKRGREWRRVPMAQALATPSPATRATETVHQALTRMAALDPDLARIVELRFFGGLEGAEVAHVLGLSRSTVARRWRVAKARLSELLVGTADEA